MAEKDIAEKTLESYNDVFCDIISVLLFNGKKIIKEDELVDVSPLSQYKADDNSIHEQERDVAKLWKNGSIRIALYGLENQTKNDKDMPLRVLSYDGATYRQQLNDEKYLPRKQKRYPAVTLILYFGEGHWTAPKTLLECLEIPEELKDFVSDYKINVFEIPYLTEEQVNMFTSDFKVVADYFVQMRKNKSYKPSQDMFKHVDEVLKLMKVLTNDQRYEDTLVNLDKGNRTGGVNMCTVLDDAEKRGIIIGEKRGIVIGEKQGEQRGIIIGEKQGKLKLLFDFVKEERISSAEAAKYLGITEEEFLEAMQNNLS